MSGPEATAAEESPAWTRHFEPAASACHDLQSAWHAALARELGPYLATTPVVTFPTDLLDDESPT